MTAAEGTAPRAHAMFKQADDLRQKARWLRADADELDRAAERFDAIASAIVDGREDQMADIVRGLIR